MILIFNFEQKKIVIRTSPKNDFLNSANYSGMKVNLFYHLYLQIAKVICDKFSLYILQLITLCIQNSLSIDYIIKDYNLTFLLSEFKRLKLQEVNKFRQ